MSSTPRTKIRCRCELATSKQGTVLDPAKSIVNAGVEGAGDVEVDGDHRTSTNGRDLGVHEPHDLELLARALRPNEREETHADFDSRPGMQALHDDEENPL